MVQKWLRLYQDVKLNKDIEYLFSPTAAHYVMNVMRLKRDDSLLVFNGVDGEWQATVTDTRKGTASYVVHHLTRKQSVDHSCALIFSPLKAHRSLFLLEKATELGVTDLYPVTMQHSAVHGFNANKARAHVIEAAEQCERLTLPIIHPMMSLTEVLNAPSLWNHRIIVGDERRSAPSLYSLLPRPGTDDHKMASYSIIDLDQPVAILVGPEGGFSTAEFNAMQQRERFTLVTLGQTVLRSETAALAALTYFHCR